MATQHKWLAWRVAVFLAALAPLLFWSWQVANNAAGPEPGRYLLLNIGIGALWLLLFTLSLTPLTKLTRWKGFALIRRQLGLWSLAYATLHMLSYALFILGLNWALLGSEIVKRPYIIVGMIALIGLSVLGATSNKWSMKRLGKRWKSLHKFSYAILGLVLLHFFWVVRADMQEWAMYAAMAALIMATRLPPVARSLPKLRYRFSR
ncbi:MULTISPECIES: protein-methionine-sulfoxide reductase heme-binding subunit MsrQ [Halomonadaceae]|jgi:methionine sulfoxide reductase heme-binding subunit|uniref:protein-methionine-sulfoxide reductase heme-binding subunit MsrQ n=1 Tax=Halomonadaceae TaxID=28256 RepID=UPI00110F65BB|nr:MULTISPECIES: protein-methionine-sulfoxide reductase heme-binding subunit MsrQ [Halomonas]QNU62698.1 protein-methionine-sulfoxide reductase heme-binding subunit MsrQ [Halomonas titanicae]TMU27158.1 protein-methionine-sulfoxide reductase heme-binding subunit MsrQ [Halomonas sp. ATBC28]CAD5275081.1 Protein-methionine-sulfoxide reductase heme-binding subunit MsrQ [Halomonas sp. 156]CAD5276817.1 Protein-methionine-sulfoxide reductase heme-binding subunit MsrQ [Halomonas sp. 113]CAD5278326.1 Pro